MTSNTIEITNGITERTSRIALKRTMTSFGEVDACHMGDRAVMGDRFTEFPIVRFKSQSSADAALQAIKSGQVFLDGLQLQAEWRGGGGIAVRQRLKPPPSGGGGRDRGGAPPPPGEEDSSSRMLLDLPANSRERTSLDTHNTFSGRDQRREDRGEASSRRLFGTKEDPPPPPKRARSRSRDRRRRSHSRSASKPKKKSSGGGGGGHGGGPHGAGGHSAGAHGAGAHGGTAAGASVGSFVGYKVIRPQDELAMGNLEAAISENPLFVAVR